MKASHGRFLALGMVALLVALVAGASIRVLHSEGQARLASPPEWVPFSADVSQARSDHPEGSLSGRFFRGRDGSTCSIMGDVTSPISVLTNDVGRRLVYRFHNDKGSWLRQPMGLPPAAAYRPPQFRDNTPGLTELSEPVEGMRAYELSRGSEARVLVPDLNFFAVRMRNDIREVEFTNIVIGATLPPECWPPPGAAITDSDEPGGIVLQYRGRHPEP